MGHPRALFNRFGEPEAPRGREPAVMACGLRVSRPAHDSNIDERYAQRSDRRWVAHAGQAHVLLLRLQADSAFQAESTHAGSPGQCFAVLEDFG